MTAILGGITVLIVVLSTMLVDRVGGAALARARAQTVADAVALAAVAESAPWGGGDPRRVAEEYADANEAVLIECLCRPGATGAQVTVEVDGVAAVARAIMDPAALAPAARGVASGLHPRLAQAVRRLVDASDGRVWLVSGFRSPTKQAALWAAALDRYGTPEAADDWVAPPGHSMHERGLAVDLGGDLVLAVSLVNELGLPLVRPLGHEPWHFELLGSRG